MAQTQQGQRFIRQAEYVKADGTKVAETIRSTPVRRKRRRKRGRAG
jgi:hypothetical protein